MIPEFSKRDGMGESWPGLHRRWPCQRGPPDRPAVRQAKPRLEIVGAGRLRTGDRGPKERGRTGKIDDDARKPVLA